VTKDRNPITTQYYLAEMSKQEELLVVVNEADFDSALMNLVPSVSETEMEHYMEMKRRFSTFD
jgi:peroxin-6